jgi:hypothetical protein
MPQSSKIWFGLLHTFTTLAGPHHQLELFPLDRRFHKFAMGKNENNNK